MGFFMSRYNCLNLFLMMVVNVGLNGSFAEPVSPTVSPSSFSSSVGNSSVNNSPNNSPKVVATEMKTRVFELNRLSEKEKSEKENIGACHPHVSEQLNRQTGLCCLGCLLGIIMFSVSEDVNGPNQTPQLSKNDAYKQKME